MINPVFLAETIVTAISVIVIWGAALLMGLTGVRWSRLAVWLVIAGSIGVLVGGVGFDGEIAELPAAAALAAGLIVLVWQIGRRRVPWRALWTVAAAGLAEFWIVFQEPSLLGQALLLILVLTTGINWLGNRSTSWRSTVVRRSILAVVATGVIGGLTLSAFAGSLLPPRYSLAPDVPSMAAAVPGMKMTAGAHTESLTALRAPNAPDGHTDEFHLVARTAAVTVGGTKYSAWTFNDTSPGPLLKVHQGDQVVVHLTNNLPVSTTIHWHGVDVPNSQDGVAGLTQNAIRPGATWTYRFNANEIGTYWYHSHEDSDVEVHRGLLGVLVVEPRQTSTSPDSERVLVMHSFGTNQQLLSAGSLLASGTSGPISAGKWVHLRVINTDDFTHPLNIDGSSFRVIALDGHAIHDPGTLLHTTISIPAGGRVDVRYQQSGTTVRIRSDEATTFTAPKGVKHSTAAPDDSDGNFDFTTYGKPGPTAITGASHIDRRFVVRTTSRLTFFNGSPDFYNVINDHLYPHGDMMMVRQGQLIEIELENRSFAEQPLHIHGHTFTVLTHNGQPLTGSPIRLDTLLIEPGDTWTIALRANNPGIWMAHCHNLEHAAQGMDLMLAYEGITTPHQAGSATGNIPE